MKESGHSGQKHDASNDFRVDTVKQQAGIGEVSATGRAWRPLTPARRTASQSFSRRHQPLLCTATTFSSHTSEQRISSSASTSRKDGHIQGFPEEPHVRTHPDTPRPNRSTDTSTVVMADLGAMQLFWWADHPIRLAHFSVHQGAIGPGRGQGSRHLRGFVDAIKSGG